ncbi:MAG: flagellin hook IN motif-containing protein [Phycisphaeraceae bacterium]
MLSNLMLSRLRKTNAEMFDTQRQISTGLKQATPSDDPSNTSAILYLRETLAARDQYEENLRHSLAVLNNVDQALGEATSILIDSQTIASSMIHASAQEREQEALVIDAQIKGLLDLANRQLDGVSLFGGNAGAVPGGVVFEEFLGGVRYLGSQTNMNADTGAIESHAFTSNGVEAFGALSTRVKTDVDLDPNASADTAISTIDGAQNQGVRTGQIYVTVDGTQVTVDLTTIDTLGDVLTRVNDAINSVDPTAGALAINGAGFELTNNAGHTIVISEVGSGQTAGDLGIDLSATAPGGSTVAGGDLGRRLTLTTALADLATTVDFASGLTITQGDQTRTADFSSATTIQDLVNEIDRLGLGLRLQINEEGNGLDLISEVSGLRLSVGENGGTTAEDLGIRTYGRSTLLSDFRDGLGIEPVEGEDDFQITLNDGTNFSVDASGLGTVDELITAIETAATGAGLTLGVDFSVDLATTGNGLVFQDNTAGANGFTITRVGQSLVADQLGILKEDGTASTFQSSDEATVRVENVFTHLMDLRDSLLNDDTLGITLAASKLEADNRSVIQARATVGVRAKRVEQQQERSQDLKIMEQSLLSDLQDADLTEVITRFTQLQTQLQASLRVGAQNLQLSLLDFLR